MIKGIQAFNACWLRLRSLYPTGRAENLMIAQAMGRVTDHYGSVEEIEQTLPSNLKSLFRKLAHAYFHGYPVDSKTTETSSAAAIANRTQQSESTRKSQLNRAPAITHDSGKAALVKKLLQNRLRRGHDFCLTNPNESATLIIENAFDR